MRYSKQREALLKLLRSTDSHPDASVLYDEMRREFPDISLATVYRNLTRLKECGDIIRVCVDDGKEHFDADVKPHNHFVCRSCGKIYDVFYHDADIDKAAQAELNAKIDYHEFTFYGICKSCMDKPCNEL